MRAELIRSVWTRANGCCEYCLMIQEFDDCAFEIDHIIAKKHGGRTVSGNLALSCFDCNSFKGSDIAGIDTRSLRLTPLFNPRRLEWRRHFRLQGAFIVGQTEVGRVTVSILHINDSFRVELRERLIDEEVFPKA